MVELTTVQIKAHRVAHFMDNMGMSREKAAAHAEVSESEWPEVAAEVQRMKETPEERASKALDARLESRFNELKASMKLLTDAVLDLRAELVDMLKARPIPQPVAPGMSPVPLVPTAPDRTKAGLKQRRKKMNLSEAERERRRERGRALAAARWAKKEPAETGPE